jgi:hypothetical protein
MKRFKLAFAVLAAVVGIGGAYASQAKVHTAVNPTLNWYTAGPGKHFFTRATVGQVTQNCTPGTQVTCLIGTTGTVQHTRKGKVLGTFHL